MGSGRPLAITGAALFFVLFLLGALIQGGCAEGAAGEECVQAATSDLYDYAQLVFFMALGAGTKQFLFSENRLTSRFGPSTSKVGEMMESEDCCSAESED